MDIKNFMYNDWVIAPDAQEPLQVTCDMMHEGYDWNPIFLTEEILKANGFRVVDEYINGDVIYECCGYNFNALNCTNYGNQEGYYFSIENNDDSVYKKCIYVHEFQHALRLCGLNKLADNLKIE